MTTIVKDSLSETCLFLTGVIIGIILDYSILYTYNINKLNKTTKLIIIGLLQLIINAMIIIYFKKYTKKLNGGRVGLGFFTMGLLSPQTLLIKNLYKK